jgi:enoyl-[acyl-carrier protein] reductase II
MPPSLPFLKYFHCPEKLLSLKQLTPVRLIKNEFYQSIKQAELNGATKEELEILLGRGRAKKGMFEGDMVEGELEIGQVAATFKSVLPAAQIMQNLIDGYNQTLPQLQSF